MKYLFRYSIIFSFILTKLQYYYRKTINKKSTHLDIVNLIDDLHITKDSAPLSIYTLFKNIFKWVPDHFIFDFGKHPEVFMYDKKDDCDGYSFFYEYILKDIFQLPEVSRYYVLNEDFKGHVVCVYRSGPIFYIVGNWKPIPITANTLEAIGNEVSAKMNMKLKYVARFEKYEFKEDLYI